MTQDRLVRTDHENGVVQIGLNRAPVNALSADFLMEFSDLIDVLVADDTVRSIVLTSGFKVFSAGLDLKEAQHFHLTQQHAMVRGLNVSFLSLYACPKPTLVAVDGAAIAGGLFFVLGSDVRISSPRASFGLAEVRVGADFPVGPLEIARAALSPDTLRRLMLTGRPIDTDSAKAAGIIDEITPSEQLFTRVMQIGGEMAQIPPQTFASVKRQIRGDTISRIEAAMAGGANAPEGGWFNDETIAAMKRMIG